MGDIRFDRAWQDLQRRREAGLSLADVDEQLLVQALASDQATREPVGRNVIATELANRAARRQDGRRVEDIMRGARETIERSTERVKRSRRQATDSRGLIDDEARKGRGE